MPVAIEMNFTGATLEQVAVPGVLVVGHQCADPDPASIGEGSRVHYELGTDSVGVSARFDARQLHWLVSLNDYTAVAMVWHDTPFVTAADMLARELLVGSNAPASDTTVWPLLLNALIGSKVKLVKGYPYRIFYQLGSDDLIIRNVRSTSRQLPWKKPLR